MLPTFRLILGTIIAAIAFVMAASCGLVAFRVPPKSFGDLPDLNRPLVRSAITKRAEGPQSRILAYARRNDELHRLLDLPVSPGQGIAEAVTTIPAVPAAEDAAIAQPVALAATDPSPPEPEAAISQPVEPAQPETAMPTLTAAASAPAASPATASAAETATIAAKPAQTFASPPSEPEKPEAEPSAPTTAAASAQIAPDATARTEPPAAPARLDVAMPHGPDAPESDSPASAEPVAAATTETAETPNPLIGAIPLPTARTGASFIGRMAVAAAKTRAEAHRRRVLAHRRAIYGSGGLDNVRINNFFERLDRNTGDNGRTIDPYRPANIGPAVR